MTSTQTNGAVATSHYLATEVGANALRAGGNAIDAAIAAAAALCVVYPNNVALGGDLVAIVRSPTGEVRFINATGPAPAAASAESMRAKYGKKLPDRGIDTITVPGGVRGWKKLAAIGGRLSWAERLEGARHYAAEGAPTATSVARALHTNRDMLRQDPGAREIFFPLGKPIQRGETLVQPALARSIEALITHGPDEFYTGELANRWRTGLRNRGSQISATDSAEYEAIVEDPMVADVLGLRIYTGGPNCQGFSLLRTLQRVEQESLSSPLRAGAARLAALFNEGNLIRDAYLTDPRSMGLSAHELLHIRPPERAPVPAVGSGDTVGLSTVSSDGWAVSLVQSVFKAFGSGVLDEETGILFQNRGTSFSLDPAHPALLQPGMRPPHTLMPVLAEEEGKLRYVNATMGGQAQPQIHAHLLLHLLDGASPLEATSAPRWIAEIASETETRTPIVMEADVEPLVRSALETSKIQLSVVPPRDEKLGHSNVIEVASHAADSYRAASDPRSDGAAVVVD